MNWKLLIGKDKFPWIVELLNDEQEIIHFASECYSTKAQALTRAKFLNKNTGANVKVLCEHAYCINQKGETK